MRINSCRGVASRFFSSRFAFVPSRKGGTTSQYILIILVDFSRDTHHCKNKPIIAKERKKERKK